MLQVFGDGTCGGLHQQLSHPPKPCRDSGLLHVQPIRTYKGHHLSQLIKQSRKDGIVKTLSPTSRKAK